MFYTNFGDAVLQVGRTPIMAAALRGHKQVIKVLLKHGANVLLMSYEVIK